MALIYRVIANEDNTIQLVDLRSEQNGKYYKEPHLEFTEATVEKCWDNENYLLKFFRGIKNNKNKYLKVLKQHCTDNKFDYAKTKEDLLDMYKYSKQLKMWKNE